MKKLVFLCMCVANCITASAQSYEAMFGQNRPVNAYPVATWDVDGQIKSGVNGEIVLTFEGDFSEAQRGCAQKTADIWAQHVALKGNMELLLKKADLGATLPSKTDVSYVYVSAGKCVPSSYDKGMNSSKRIFGADAIITYNLNVDWNCDFPGSEAKSKSDFMGETLRGIAHALGFGTSLYQNTVKGVVFSIKGCYSPFDNLVLNQNGSHLKTLPNTGQQEQAVVDFIGGKNGSVYVAETNGLYQLHTSGTYQGNGILNYFAAGGSLMSYDWNTGSGDYNTCIDDRTLDVLERTGWEVRRTNLCINPDPEVSAGNASAYGSYTFTASSKNGTSVSGQNWTLEVKDTTGNYVAAQTSKSASFILSPVADLAKYRKMGDGNLQGRVILEAFSNGALAQAYYTVYLNVKPVISEVKTQVVAPDFGKGTFALDVEVHYKGTNSLTLMVEQEDVIDVSTYYLDQPDVVYERVSNLFVDVKTWLYFSSYNEYGETTYTVELDALTRQARSVSNGGKNGIGSSLSLSGSNIEYIDVYTVGGIFVKRISSLYNLKEDLENGPYVLKIKRENSEVVESKKTVIR